MRILHVSDFHFYQPWFDWAERVALQFDAVALTGDLLGPCHDLSAEKQVGWLTNWIKSFPGKLLLCSGYEDEQRDDLPVHLQSWLRNLRAPGVTTDGRWSAIGGWRFECVGWGEVPQLGGKETIALASRPPRQSNTSRSQLDGADRGDAELGASLRHHRNAPAIVLSGHIHCPRNYYDLVGDTWSLNPGRGEHERMRPNHFIVDLAAGVAEWHGANGSVARLYLSYLSKTRRY